MDGICPPLKCPKVCGGAPSAEECAIRHPLHWMANPCSHDCTCLAATGLTARLESTGLGTEQAGILRLQQ